MHPSAMLHGKHFIESLQYRDGRQVKVVEVGAQDDNGSLRAFIPDGYHYTGCDFVEGRNVDQVLEDPYCLPFEECSVDVVIASSCFEHSDMFWLVFLEVLRILKTDGLFYLNTPSNGYIHRHPVDSWRFYPDSGKSLVQWGQRNGYSPVLIESFVGAQLGPRPEERWNDYVGVFGKTGESISRVAFHVSDKAGRVRYLQRYDLGVETIEPSEPEDLLNILKLDEENAALKAQMTCLEEVNAGLKSGVTRLEEVNAELRSGLTRLGKVNAELKSGVVRLEAEQATLINRVSGLEQAGEVLRGRVSELMLQNQALLTSHSWQLTAPLRFIKQLLSGRSVTVGSPLPRKLKSLGRAVYRRAPAFVQPLLHRVAFRLFGHRLLQGAINIAPGHFGAAREPIRSLDYRELAEKGRVAANMKEQSVAVVIHVFYPDVFEEMAHYFRNLGRNCDFYLTVTDEASRLAVMQVLDGHGVVRYEVKVCPNRGRNFAPWLVAFSTQIQAHELMLHLHTKKSLRTGGDQKAWRTHLFDCLLGSPATVDLIRGVYRDQPHAGVIAPETHAQGASYWFHHWLSVGHLLPDFFARLNITRYPKRGFIDFPVGAMFWARVAALKPLFDVEWRYEDFESEPAGDDGTLPHAIERSIGVIAEETGYVYGEINPRSERFLWGGGSKLLSHYLETSRHIKEAAGFPVVSFDFFDTLFSRISVSPEDVQHYIGFELEQRHAVSCADDFYTVRKSAELRARALAENGEVKLSEIYGCFSFFGWEADIARAAMAIELEIEQRCLVPRRAVLGVLCGFKLQGKRVIVVSDSYFERSFIVAVLEKFGVMGQVDEIYVSSELGRRKDRGDIWPYLIALEGPLIRHVGDNEQSDIQQVLRNGLSAVGILNPAVLALERGLRLPDGWREGEGDWRDGLALGPAVQAIANNPLLDKGFKPVVLANLVDVGYLVYGPLIMAFLNWLSKQLVSGHYERVLFLARDGFYLKEIFDRYYADLYGEKTEYFFCSRQSLLAVLWGQGIEVEDLFRGGRFNGTMSALLKARLGFAAVGGNELVVLPGDEAKVKQYVLDHRDAIAGYCIEQSAAFSAYMAALDIDPAGRCTLVDLGYAGTIQHRLQKILQRPLDGFYMITNLAAQQVEEAGGQIQGFFNDALHLKRSMQPVEAHSLALEAVFTAPHGQVVGYTRPPADAPLALPERIVFSDKDQPALDLVCTVIEGVNRYFSSLLEAYGPSVLKVEFSPVTAQYPFALMIEGGIVLPEAFSGQFKVEDDFCGNGELNVSQFLGLRVSSF